VRRQLPSSNERKKNFTSPDIKYESARENAVEAANILTRVLRVFVRFKVPL